MAPYPPSAPKPSVVVRRSHSFCLGFSSHKKGFPLKPKEVVIDSKKSKKDEISRLALRRVETFSIY